MDGDLTEKVTLGTGIHVDTSIDLNAASERFSDSRVVAFDVRNDSCVTLNRS